MMEGPLRRMIRNLLQGEQVKSVYQNVSEIEILHEESDPSCFKLILHTYTGTKQVDAVQEIDFESKKYGEMSFTDLSGYVEMGNARISITFNGIVDVRIEKQPTATCLYRAVIEVE